MSEPVADAAAGTRRVSCATCGRTATRPSLDWSSEHGPSGRSWLCGACTRANLRSLEARLDPAWW